MPEIKIKVRDKCADGEGVIICNNSDYTVVWDLDVEWTPYDTKTMRVNLADGSYQDVVFTGSTAALPVLTASGWVSVGLYAGDLHTSRAARLLALSSVLTPGGSPAAPAEDVYAQIMAKLNELSTVSPEDIAKAVEDYLTEHPAASASMRVEGGYIQFSADGKSWENVIALADLKGAPGKDGSPGKDGLTPHIGDNGNWYLGDEDTGKPSRGAPGAKGDPGKDGAGMDVTGATVGQIAVVAAVDADGVPTAWEPVDMPSGGEEKEWTLIRNLTLEAQVDRVDITTDEHGNTFSLSECYCAISTQSYEDSESEVFFLPNGGWTTGDPTLTSTVKSSKSSATWRNGAVFHAVSSGTAIVSEQLPCRSANNFLNSNAKLNQAKITKLSFAGKFGVGCSFWIIGR